MEQKQGVLIADLSGYTAVTEAHGARTAAGLVKRFVELVNQSLAGNSRFVQQVGDEVLIISNKTDDLLKTAWQLQALTQLENEFLAVHAGIHYGELLEEDGNFFGSTINLASRIAAHSAGGQVLCSAAALSSLQDHSWVDFNSLGFVRFKNVKEPVEIFAAAFHLEKPEKVFDPVCRMAVDPNSAAGAVEHAGKTYFFCSLACLNSFSEDPSSFLTLPG
jgi:adenylate cyclase